MHLKIEFSGEISFTANTNNWMRKSRQQQLQCYKPMGFSIEKVSDYTSFDLKEQIKRVRQQETYTKRD